MSNREVLTLQFGNYSNYIGAHWWNIQESGFNYDASVEGNEINHNVLYREGVNNQGQTTYTPRLLLADLDGSLKHLPVEGELYGNSVKRAAINDEKPIKKLKEDIQWEESSVEVIAEPEVTKNEFQMDLNDPDVNVQEKEYNLSESVETWSDFLYTRYHPRTVNVIKEYKTSSEKQSFDTFSSGVALWKSEQFVDEFCDKIRQYVEECDYLQGFQTIFDCYNGYSGLATKCLEHLNEEYSKANFAVPVFVPKSVLFENADDAMSDSIRVINSALAYNQLIDQCSMFVPLSTQDRVWRQLGSKRNIRSLNYKEDNLYQTSAILAAYLDTISLRYRLKDAPQTNSLSGFCGDLTNYGRKMTAASFAMPFPMKHNEDLIDCLDKFEGNLFTQLSPNCSIGTNYIIQSLCVRGIPKDRLKRPMQEAQQQMKMAAYKCDSVSQMFQLYLQCANHASLAHVSAVTAPMAIKVPFPSEMFDDCLNKDGFNLLRRRDAVDKIGSVPTLASMQSSAELGDTLETLHREAKRIKIGKIHRYKEAGLELDDYADALENILLFKDHYEDNFEL